LSYQDHVSNSIKLPRNFENDRVVTGVDSISCTH